MKPPDLLQFHVKTNNNVRLQPKEFHPSLENQVLANASSVLSQNLCLPPPSWAIQTSTTFTCPALQATSLSSTTSKLLSSTLSSFPTASSLLSTKNSCLKENQLQTASTCFHKPFLSSPETCTASALHLPEALKVTTSFQVKQEAQTDESSSSEMEYSEETVQDVRLGHSEEDGKMLLEMPVLNEEEQQAVTSLEDFEELEANKDDQSEDLKYRKYKLLNFVCCSLASKSCSPGQKDWDEKDSVWSAMKTLATVVTSRDPEFLLKVAIYTRQELNIRVTANFLLALAAHLPESKPHFRRYFCPAIQLPSDWLEVIRIYSTCFSKSLPSCLKKGLSDKFKEFSEYQLAKYNTRKHRCKHQKRAKKGKQPSPKDWKTWGDLVRVHESILQKYLQNKPHVAVDKKQTEFSLKKMIKRLHIKESAEHVMAILGKKYPSDLKAFSRSGLSGVWDRERAGKRMKLKQPDTWEHKLSQEGNKAATWEKLIDGRSLPFMAMLRNLRNMISVGISQKHHAKILSRLTSKDAVIKSRQFPFRFLSAYKVIMELSKFVARPAEAAPSSMEIVRDVLKKLPKSKHYKLNWDTAQRKRLKVTMRVPFIYRLYNIKRNLLRKANQRLYTRELLDKYCVALEKAVQISCKYNIPPLPGRTLVLCSSQLHDEENWSSEAQELCLPPDCSEKEEGEDQLSVSVQEVALLLSMMIKHCSEDCQVMLTSYSTFLEIKESSENLLENVKQSIKLVKKMHDEDLEFIKPSTFFTTLTEQKTKFDRIVVIESDYINSSLKVQLDNYRKNSNCNAVLIYLMLMNKSSANDSNNDLDSNAVQFSGFTEQVLKFVSERGSSRMLQHIDNIDKIYSVPPPQGQKTAPQSNSDISPLLKTPKLKWRGVRVFISSTFRDMHSERDVLVRSVFPELRRRAAPHFLYLQEVELRWGVTEEESNRTVELCLSEVCRSQLLLGILGERYGLVPPHPSLPSLPQYSWLESAPPGLSVTEMEIRQFKALFPDSAQSRMLFYFRSPRLTSSVPVAWRPDFVAESKEAEAKMNNLKTWIRNNEFKVTENYPCEWGGVVDGKPSVKGLEEFAKTAMEDIWETIEKLFVEEADEDVISEIKEQELHQEAQHRQFHGRAKLVSMATDKVKECQQKGGVLLIDGNPGDGKTVFMAALAQTLKTAHPLCDVISYSTDASQSACSVGRLLRCLVQWLRKRSEDDDELAPNMIYRELLSEFHLNLSKQGKRKPLALLVDGADRVHDGRGQWVSEWIPQLLPKGVCLVLSVRPESSLQNTISRRKSTVSFPLGLLSLPDKKEIVQKQLVIFGKKLSDSAFNNQLQTLLMKKGSVSPLYLHLACEELRNYASFDTMKETLQALPQSLCELVQHSLLRLESQYGGVALGWALSALTISSVGLRESALYSILNLCNDLNSRGGPRTWMEVLPVARRPEIRVPMAVFSQLARTLHSIIAPGSDDLLILRHPEVKAAFERLYLSNEEDQTRSHLILAAHLWTRANPQGNDMFLHSDADSLSLLPTHLMAGNQQKPLCHLLSNYYFLYANVRHGLLHQLLEVYILFDKKYELHQTQDDTEDVKDCLSFLKRHSLLFSQWPALFVQTALNEPDGSSARAWAENATRSGRVHVMMWKNNEDAAPKEPSEQVSTFCSTPSCVVVSPDEEFVVVGTEEGTLHFVHAGTGQEVKTLVSSGDGISGCLFLGKQLITTSFDGQIEVWDAESGCRTTSTGAHSNKITGCDASPDSKHFATVSLDFSLKVWSVQKNKEVVTLQNPTPLNCVTFDLEGHLLAVGCWGGAVCLWNWLEQKNVTTLCGHQNSVRSLSFSPCSSMLSSGCVSGEVRLWSVAAATCVGRYQAHCGSTQSLNFLQGGNLLLSSGQDCVVQVWSGSLGRSVAVLEAPYQKQIKPEEEKAKALCVAVSDGFATVGYHGDGIKMFNLVSGKQVWSSDGLQVSMLCVLWVKINGQEFVLSGGFDHHLRVWERPKDEARCLVPLGCFGVQKGAILAMSQNATHFATASDDFTIALWLKRDLAYKPWVAPGVMSILRGHNGGVTCLAFSPDGQTLLSGGKDQALIVWKVSSSPVLSKLFPHCHGDWITGCAWTSSALLSCSSDCKLRMWDVQTGSLQREILFGSSLSSLCCWEEYVMAGSADGLLMVWKWENGLEVTRIQAHASRVHHCTVVPPSDESESVKPEDLLVASASEDGTIKLWHPLQVQHHSTLHGHSAEIQAVVCKQAEFLTVSSDRSLRSWSVSAALETPFYQKGKLKAVCFLDVDDLLACCYSTGRLEIWKQSVLVYFKKVGDSSVSAVTGMPDAQLAVACIDCSVSVWKLELDSRSCIVGLEKVSSYTTESPVSCLLFCSLLFGACADGTIVDVASTADSWTRTISDWSGDVSPVGVFINDCKSFWLVAVHRSQIRVGFVLVLGTSSCRRMAFCETLVEENKEEAEEVQPEEEEQRSEDTPPQAEELSSWITAAAIQNELIVCGDSEGNMWFNQTSNLSAWTERRPAHTDRVSVLKITESLIISASYDRTIKLWDRHTKKQLGMFVCGGPVLLLEFNPRDPRELVCGDTQGQLYFLSWTG